MSGFEIAVIVLLAYLVCNVLVNEILACCIYGEGLRREQRREHPVFPPDLLHRYRQQVDALAQAPRAAFHLDPSAIPV
jgi:hypothetical protein